MKLKTLLPLVIIATVLMAWKQNPPIVDFNEDKGKIKVLILYPNEDGKSFDMDYYAKSHMPMVADLFGDYMKSYGIEKGVSGRTPEDPTTYVAIGYFYFDQLSDYEKAFGSNAEKILGDIPNYTDIQPIVQINEIVH